MNFRLIVTVLLSAYVIFMISLNESYYHLDFYYVLGSLAFDLLIIISLWLVVELIIKYRKQKQIKNKVVKSGEGE